jgi:hypothetical protein
VCVKDTPGHGPEEQGDGPQGQGGILPDLGCSCLHKRPVRLQLRKQSATIRIRSDSGLPTSPAGDLSRELAHASQTRDPTRGTHAPPVSGLMFLIEHRSKPLGGVGTFSQNQGKHRLFLQAVPALFIFHKYMQRYQNVTRMVPPCINLFVWHEQIALSARIGSDIMPRLTSTR